MNIEMLQKNRYITITLAIIFLVAWLQLLPDKVLAQTPWDKKAPPSVITDVASGKPYDLIVLFDDRPIQDEIAFYRFNISAIGDTPEILEIKRIRYEHLKQRVFDTLLREEFELKREYSHLPMSFIRIKTLSGLIQLLSQAEIVQVYPEEKHRHFLSSSLPFIGQPQVAAAGMRGAGTTVVVLDTGLNYNHSHFGTCTSPAPGYCSDTNPPTAPSGCKVSCVRDFAPNDNSLDDNGHGTNVSGIVVGVAPDTHIAALDVFRTDGLAYSSDIIAAINWSIANKAAYNIVAMNMSLGGGGSTTPCSSNVFAVPISNAKSAGILSAIASGNDGFTNKISSPACVPDAVSVGAVYDGNIGGVSYPACTDTTTAPDKVTCFTNSASFLTMLAPGARITAAGWTMFGTSQAAPHIAGSIAVLKGQNAFPSETPNQVVSRMTSSGIPVTDSKNNITKPRIDLLAASSGGGACTYNISPTSQAFGTAGGNGSVTVTTGNECDWTAVSNNSWISITGGNQGTGNGTVTYSVASNDGNSRTGTLTIAGKTFTINQTGIGNMSITGTITRAGTPLAGVAVNLTGTATASTTTNANGNYTFSNLANGNYTITPSLSGFTFTPLNRAVVINNANATGQNFTATALAFTITGTITSGGSPLAGVTLTLTGAASRTAVSNSAGVYIFAGLGVGTYTITPTLSGYTFTPTNRTVSISRANVTGQNFTATPAAGTFLITGTITISGGGGPLAGVTVTLGGAGSAVTTTNASGVYTFTNLANGAYTVTPTLAGFTFSPISINVTVNNANVVGQDFTATAVGGGVFSISGRITNILGGSVSGVTVNLTGAASRTTTTNTNGEYIFSNLANGSYRVTPTATGLAFTPAFRDVTINNANVTGQNFTAARTR